MTDTPPRSATPEPRRRYRNGPKVQALLDAHGNGTWGSVRLGQVFDAIEEVEAEARSVPPSEPPALDVERLARHHTPTLRTNPMTGDQWWECRCGWLPDDEEHGLFVAWPAHFAAEYAALRPPAEDPA